MQSKELYPRVMVFENAIENPKEFLNQIMNQSQTEDGIVNMTHIEFYKLEANYQ